jgi:DNA (cytosine-5)-methyltransferase 1
VNDSTIRVCELFAGIGGFRAGLQAASNKFKTVYANEYNKYASAIYRHHYGSRELWEADITKVNPKTVSDFDLLTAGFPCQPFSVAGKRQGVQDSRGVLFADVLRFAKEKQPKLVLLENVPGLFSISKGEVFKSIIMGLAQLGYTVEWKVLNSCFFGVPQRRRRVYIVGYFANQNRRVGTFFPLDFSKTAFAKKAGAGQVSSTRVASQSKGQYGGETFLIDDHRSTRELRIYDGYAPTVVTMYGTGGGNVPYVLHPTQAIRRLTVVECERLQGFPDDYTRYGVTASGECVEISKSRRLQCIGNAVTVNVVKQLGENILSWRLI